MDVVSDTIELSVQAQDERATITLSNGMTTYVGTGSLTKELMLYQETDELEIQILSVDGKQEENRTIKFTKAAYLSDMEYNAGATVG